MRCSASTSLHASSKFRNGNFATGRPRLQLSKYFKVHLYVFSSRSVKNTSFMRESSWHIKSSDVESECIRCTTNLLMVRHNANIDARDANINRSNAQLDDGARAQILAVLVAHCMKIVQQVLQRDGVPKNGAGDDVDER
jgi:hypothetical protein